MHESESNPEIIGLLCDGHYGWYTPVTFADMDSLPVHCWDNLLPLPEKDKDKGKDDNN